MSSLIHRHPDDATLMSFAAGTLAEPLAAVVAAHVTMCTHCRAEVADMELIGAVLMTASARGEDASAAMVTPARPPEPGRGIQADAAGSGDRLPAPIASVYGLTFDTIPWKWLGPGLQHHRLALSAGVEGDLRLLKIAPGPTMPEHGHSGAELTLVLAGAYADETGSYGPGDIQDVDGAVDHTPISDRDQGCICIIASEGPARFKGLIAKLTQPWTGM